MGHKQSKVKAAPDNFPAVYLLADSEDRTLAEAQLQVVADENTDAVILFPDPEIPSANSSGARKYKASFIHNGNWGLEKDIRREISVGDIIPNNQTSINAALTRLARHGINTTPLLSLNGGTIVKYALPPFHDTKSLVAFAKTSFVASQLSKPALEKVKIKKLFDHVIHGEQLQAENLLNHLLKTNAHLVSKIFTQKMLVTDYSGRRIEGTLFQLALGAEDVKYIEDEECMAEMLMRFVRQHQDIIPHAEAMLESQYGEQFPDDSDANTQEAERVKQDSEALHQILDVIGQISEAECQAVHDVDDQIQKLLHTEASKTHDPEILKELVQSVLQADKEKFEIAFNHFKNYIKENELVKGSRAGFQFDALRALYQFRNHLESQTKEIIKTGKHFNAELLLEAFKLYDENYNRFGDNLNTAKNIVSWRKVIGYIQRFVTACLAQAMHQGIYYIVENREKLQRLPAFKYSESYQVLPLVSSSPLTLGYEFASAVAWSAAAACDFGVPGTIRFFKTYGEQKHHRCKAYATSGKSVEEHSRGGGRVAPQFINK